MVTPAESRNGMRRQPPPQARTNDLRIGVIGCGRAADRLHLPALARLPGVKVTALADTDASRLGAAGIKWRVDKLYPDYRLLVDQRSVDVVLIAVPAPLHHNVFHIAAGAGKHIYIEKPLATNLDDADRMVATAEQLSIGAAVGFNLRSHRLVRQARALVREGKLGPILAVRTVWIGGRQERPDWQRHRAEGGGALYELAVHHFDLWRFLFDTEVVCINTQSPANGSDDARVCVTAQLGNGVLACSVFALEGLAMHEVEVIGESASLRFSLYRADSLAIRPAGRVKQIVHWLQQLPEAVKAAQLGGDYLDSYRTHWLRFIESIRGGESPATLQDGRAALRVALEVIECLNREKL